MPTVIKKLDAGAYQLKDQVVSINRVTKVVKGGKNLSFAALVVVGDPSAGVVGFGEQAALGFEAVRKEHDALQVAGRKQAVRELKRRLDVPRGRVVEL